MSTRAARAAKIVACLKKMYPQPKTELAYRFPFQLVVAVILSAQCTDKLVNKVTALLFKKYKTPKDFAKAKPGMLTREISRVSFYRNKAKHIIAAAKMLEKDFGGVIPQDAQQLQKLPGVGYKTAHVILGELYDMWDGIPTDTHVKRFARKFDLTDATDLKKISHDLEALISRKDWKYVNNGFVLYGRYVCKANRHECRDHPLTKLWPPAKTRWPQARV
jgi:endonuclease-3